MGCSRGSRLGNTEGGEHLFEGDAMCLRGFPDRLVICDCTAKATHSKPEEYLCRFGLLPEEFSDCTVRIQCHTPDVVPAPIYTLKRGGQRGHIQPGLVKQHIHTLLPGKTPCRAGRPCTGRKARPAGHSPARTARQAAGPPTPDLRPGFRGSFSPRTPRLNTLTR